MVFIDVSSYCIQHELFIYFFCTSVIETPEVFIFLDISKVTFRLNEKSNPPAMLED